MLTLVVFWAFSLGLFSISQVVRNAILRKFCKTELPRELNDCLVPGSLTFLLGIVGFCGLCNLLLLIPSCLELAGLFDSALALEMHRLTVLVLLVLVGLVAILGLIISVVRLSRGKLSSSLSNVRVFGVSVASVSEVEHVFVYIASFCVGAFLLVSKEQTYVDDSLLYHLPLINHLAFFGPEVGLANLMGPFGHYSIQSYGQVPFQFLPALNSVVSPSFNVLFLMVAVYAVYESLASSFESIKAVKHGAGGDAFAACVLKPVVVASYWALVFGFGITFWFSLVSFNADYSVALASSVVVFAVVASIASCRITGLVILSILSLPLLKLSGLVPVFCISILLVVYWFSFVLRPGFASFLALSRSVLASLKSRSQLSLFFVAGMFYLLLVATNVVTTGYLVFPQYQTGPVASYGLPGGDVVVLKHKYSTDWARFNYDGVLRPTIPKARPDQWKPEFVRSFRGARYRLWIVGSAIMAAIAALLVVFGLKPVDGKILLSTSAAAALTAWVALNVLPPDPRFYAWLEPVAYFSAVQLLALYPLLGLVLIVLVTFKLDLRSRLGRVPPVQLQEKEFSRAKLRRFWWSRMGSDGRVKINMPNPSNANDSAVCGNAYPPCTLPHHFDEDRLNKRIYR